MTHENELPAEDRLENQRDTIRQSLNQITAELNSALATARARLSCLSVRSHVGQCASDIRLPARS